MKPGKTGFPDTSFDTRQAVEDAADIVQSTAISAFIDNYRVREIPEFVLKEAQGNADEMVKTIRRSIEAVQLESSKTPDFNIQLNDYETQITDLVNEPQRFAEQTAQLLAALGSIYSNPVNAFMTYRRLLERANDTIPTWEATPSRQQMRRNREVQMGMLKRLSVVGMARAATHMQFESYDEAVRFRQDIGDLLDDELIRLGSTDYDQLFFALEDLRAQVINDLTERSINLDRMKTVRLVASLPTDVLSYHLYGDSLRSEEIRNRNRIRHPLFVPAATEIQVLVD